jgi:hypothetical protein
MAVNSCEKGKRIERALAKLLRNHGFTSARRGQQFKGTKDSADVVEAIPGVHIESKGVKSSKTLHRWMEKCEKECAADEDPAVFILANRKRPLVVLDAKDFLDFMAEMLEHRRSRPLKGTHRACDYCGQICWGTCQGQMAAQRGFELREGKKHGEAQAPIADHVHLQRGPKPTGESTG